MLLIIGVGVIFFKIVIPLLELSEVRMVFFHVVIIFHGVLSHAHEHLKMLQFQNRFLKVFFCDIPNTLN